MVNRTKKKKKSSQHPAMIPIIFSFAERSLCFAFSPQNSLSLLCAQVCCPSLPAIAGGVDSHPLLDDKCVVCGTRLSPCRVVQSLPHRVSLLGIGYCHLQIEVWPDRLTSGSQGQRSPRCPL